MSEKITLMEALDTIAPCDIEALASYMSQSESVVNAMLVNQMRKGTVRCITGQYQLTGKVVNGAPRGQQVTNVVTRNPDSVKATSEPAPPAPPAVEKVNKEITVPAIELIRTLLRESKGEVTPRELAEAANVEQKSISGRLAKDVDKGVVTLRKDGQRSFYRWSAGVDQKPKFKAAEQQKTVAAQGSACGSMVLTNRIKYQAGNISPRNPDRPREIEFPDTITVPTSIVLTDQLKVLDATLAVSEQQVGELKGEINQKRYLLVLVEKLESHLRGANP
ncbi:winged helix-turn-helix domain-containing protein [Rouxiella badensis]|uniref:ArsR/SmtB family transcription factor n=1 Tax=Rouxiella badensis TaxID=1646377 RepID=UPI001D148DE6|nr:winged helix-turn-helix domain-containing protein [Rouxiella badensis]MCC3705191.1 winged helix-turn-helix domain-containing protein [Rouxiella badensis]